MENFQLFLYLRTEKGVLCMYYSCLKFRSVKNSADRLGTFTIIPRKTVLLSRNSVCLGIVHSEVRNGTEWNSLKIRFDGTAKMTTERLFISQTYHVSERVSKSFFICLVVRNEIPVFLSSAKWFETEFRACKIFAEWFGTKLQVRMFISSTKWFETEFWALLSYMEWLGMESRAFSIPRNRRNSDGINHNIRWFSAPRDYFFLGKWNP